jgi:coatomer subunit beta'
LKSKGFKQQALVVTKDAEHKFDLSLQLGDLKTAYNIALENEVISKYFY